MAHVSFTWRQAWIFVDRLETWFVDWRQAVRDIRSQAELARKLKGIDDHRLSDMGLRWTGRHFERVNSNDSHWR